MTPSPIDPTLDRLLRHMAWANGIMLGKLAQLPDGALALAAPKSDWTVGAIVQHYVRSAGFYAMRLGAKVDEFTLEVPVNSADVLNYQRVCSTHDALLREIARIPESSTTFVRDGETITRARSTVLGQSIYHAIEHRAQIADILVMHGINKVDLDELDIWALSDAEGLGE